MPDRLRRLADIGIALAALSAALCWQATLGQPTSRVTALTRHTNYGLPPHRKPCPTHASRSRLWSATHWRAVRAVRLAMAGRRHLDDAGLRFLACGLAEWQR